jgi:hypothetical protein
MIQVLYHFRLVDANGERYMKEISEHSFQRGSAIVFVKVFWLLTDTYCKAGAKAFPLSI